MCKFRDPTMKQLLLGTGDALLVEHTTNDAYWADNGDGTGYNQLGVMLMCLRKWIREDLSGFPPIPSRMKWNERQEKGLF